MTAEAGAAGRRAPDQTAKHTSNSDQSSTATAAQERRIIEALRRGPQTTDQLRALGCYQVSARIFGLRRRGFGIVTSLFDGYAVDGYSHRRMALYSLIDEPQEVTE